MDFTIFTVQNRKFLSKTKHFEVKFSVDNNVVYGKKYFGGKRAFGVSRRLLLFNFYNFYNFNDFYVDFYVKNVKAKVVNNVFSVTKVLCGI